MTAPATTSLWPPRYLVALCITPSTPCSIGLWFTGEANVLSAKVVARTDFAAATASWMSVIIIVGFAGVSMYTNRVLGRTAAFHAPGRRGSTKGGSTPNPGRGAAKKSGGAG